MAVSLVDKDNQYVLNHCTRFLARHVTDLVTTPVTSGWRS